MSARLLIVYNADAGPLAALFDMAHKIVAPATYPCSLCAVTYGAVAMKPAWRDYLRALPLPVAFFHRQDFHAAYPALAATPLPLIARDDDGVVTVVLDAAALASLTKVEALIAALDPLTGCNVHSKAIGEIERAAPINGEQRAADELAWQWQYYNAAYDFAAAVLQLHETNPWPQHSALDAALNTLMTELWDRGFSQTEIRTAFLDAIADMPRYAAGEEVRT